MYKFFLSREADKSYEQLPLAEKKKIDKILAKIAEDPFRFSKKLQGEFAGLRAVRAWPYRITFNVSSKEKQIFVAAIAHRGKIYKRA